MIDYIFGIDPSFSGLGLSKISLPDKIIYLDQKSVDISDGKFIAISNACLDMIVELLSSHPELSSECSYIGMETPPVMARFTEKLWSLDTLLYRSINKPYVFNVSYIRFLHGTSKYSKKNTIDLVNKLLEIFVKNGYVVNQLYCSDKTGKPKKMTDNESDSFIYATRMFVKYHLDNNIESSIVNEILENYIRFKEIKEDY